MNDAISTRARFRAWLVWPVLVGAALAGCSAMEGVNVGASIPIGGMVSVGANKTIGSQAPAPTQKKTTEKSGDSTSEKQ